MLIGRQFQEAKAARSGTARIRKRIEGTAERPRLAVFRARAHIYAQVIDDVQQRTLVSRPTSRQGAGRRGRARPRPTRRRAPRRSARAIAKKCLEKGIDKVVFDRNGYIYHGRVTAVADGAREAG